MKSVPDWILVGMVKRIHGNSGEMLVKSLTDREERFSEGSELYISRKRENERTRVTVTASRPSDRGPLIRLSGIESRTDAEPFFGASLFIPSADAAPPVAGSYYSYQIEGSRVYQGGSLVGTVTRLYENLKANPYIEVQPEGEGRPVFIPFVSHVIESIDTEERRIDIVEGFLG